MSFWTAPILVPFVIIVYSYKRHPQITPSFVTKPSPGIQDHVTEQTTTKAHLTAVAFDVPALALETEPVVKTPANVEQATRSIPPPPAPHSAQSTLPPPVPRVHVSRGHEGLHQSQLPADCHRQHKHDEA